MATEFKKAESDLDETSKLLSNMTSNDTTAKRSQIHNLEALAGSIQANLQNFRRKREETIEVDDESAPDGKKQIPKYYGPKMMQKVLGYENRAIETLKQIETFQATVLKSIQIEEDLIQQDTTKTTTSTATSAFNPILKGPTIVRASEAEVKHQQRIETDENAKRAVEALKVLESKQTDDKDDPFLKEKRLFESLIIGQGIDGFNAALAQVDSTRRKQLASILEVITKHPENVQFRTLFLANISVASLLEGSGVRECLGALGFRPQLAKSTKAEDVESVAYFLQEPSLESDMDAWSLWFDTLKAALEMCKQK